MITNNLNALKCNKLIIIFMKLIFTNCSKIFIYCYRLSRYTVISISKLYLANGRAESGYEITRG